MRAHFKHQSLKSFLMVEGILQFNEFEPLQLPFEDSKLHWDSNFQSGNPLGLCVFIPSHSLTFLGT
jgi:hypothetical protein